VNKAVFLESSALLRFVFSQPGAAEVDARLDVADRVIGSRLLRIECERAVLRHVAERPGSTRRLPELNRALREVWPLVDFWDISEDICELAGRIAPQTHLRSLDAIHLATWQRAREHYPHLEFLTFDDRLRALV
jgi:predicted nucleic acid-binding protein